jgi:prolyl-tRNA editing enzyme YbaK/EbsC (Cys-tRNA(Pro) deacylase)
VEQWPEPVARVAEVLKRSGTDARVEEFPEGTPTAGAAAKAVGASRAQIVKSLVFVCDGRPILALVPGDRRADENKVAAAAGARCARVARPDEVHAATGFEPGGVAPFPAPGVSQVLIAGELLVHERVWIGAGSERHMAGISPLDLARLTGARAAELS